MNDKAAGVALFAATAEGFDMLGQAIGRQTVSGEDLYLFVAGREKFLHPTC
jgi:hypothetical protein